MILKVFVSVSRKGERMKEAFDLIRERLEEESYYSCFHCMESAISIVSEVEVEYGNGWIPVEKALPKERDWYLAMFKEPDTGFMGLPHIADYLMGVHTNYTTEDGWIIANCTDIEDERAEYYKKLVCVAWMPLPEPYKPEKGE
jgi:hypothetical protein